MKDRRNELGSYYTDLERDYREALKKYERAVKNDDDDVEELKADVLELKQSLAEAEDEADALYMSRRAETTLASNSCVETTTDAQQAYRYSEAEFGCQQKKR